LDDNYDDTDDDDEEEENRFLPELGLPTHSGGQGMSFSLLNIISSLTLARDYITFPLDNFNKVRQWQVAAQ